MVSAYFLASMPFFRCLFGHCGAVSELHREQLGQWWSKVTHSGTVSVCFIQLFTHQTFMYGVYYESWLHYAVLAALVGRPRLESSTVSTTACGELAAPQGNHDDLSALTGGVKMGASRVQSPRRCLNVLQSHDVGDADRGLASTH